MGKPSWKPSNPPTQARQPTQPSPSMHTARSQSQPARVNARCGSSIPVGPARWARKAKAPTKAPKQTNQAHGKPRADCCPSQSSEWRERDLRGGGPCRIDSMRACCACNGAEEKRRGVTPSKTNNEKPQTRRTNTNKTKTKRDVHIPNHSKWPACRLHGDKACPAPSGQSFRGRVPCRPSLYYREVPD